MGNGRPVLYHGKQQINRARIVGNAPMPVFADDIARLIPSMRRFARALVSGHSVQSADDLVQETVVLAMRAERLASGSNLAAWCFSTLMRVHRLREASMMSAVGAVSASPGPAANRGASAVPFLPKPIARLDVLSLDCREVLLLAVLVGMTYAEIAETLHITPDTVIHRLELARGLMAKADRAGAPPQLQKRVGGPDRPPRQPHHLRLVK